MWPHQGLSIKPAPGPGSLALFTVMGFILLLLLWISTLLAANGLRPWVLASAAVGFAVLRTTLELSKANLSKTIRNPIEIRYLSTSKQPSPDRADACRTTSVLLTAIGRYAFDRHMAALHELAAGSLTPHR